MTPDCFTLLNDGDTLFFGKVEAKFRKLTSTPQKNEEAFANLPYRLMVRAISI